MPDSTQPGVRTDLRPGGPPHVLLLATQRWPTGARLGLAMQAVGFQVSLWAPSQHPLLVTRACSHHYPYHAIETMASLETAVLSAEPHLIVPCDDLATYRLQLLAKFALQQPRLHRVAPLIEHSLGPLAQLANLTSRSYVLDAAARDDVAVPANLRIHSPEQLRAWLDEHGFPAFLKADGTSGGIGVRPVHNYQQAMAALRALDAPPNPLRALKRLAIDRDSTLLGPLVRRYRPSISVQRAVAGREANSAIFCWRGEVLASISVEVLATRYQRGPSTVVRRIHHPAMDHAARAIASRLELSGFYGLDFILEDHTASGEHAGTAWLLEMNSRATQIAHLALGAGHDLPAAAFAAISDTPLHPRASVTNADTIALFPQEWQRDPSSPLLKSAFHDVPWDAPELVRFYVNQRSGWRHLLTYQYWRERRHHEQALEASAPSETATRVP
jgi:hypothetical protein